MTDTFFEDGSHVTAPLDTDVFPTTTLIAGLPADGYSLWSDIKTALGAIFAPIAKGVTNGDSHNHLGGDGAPIPLGGIAGYGTPGNMLVDSGTAWVSTPANYRYINTQFLSTAGSGTYTPSTGTNLVLVEGWGGGGAGGGAATGSSTCSIGVGGGGGAYSFKRISGVTGTIAYVVGSGGTGNFGLAGDAGTDTTFGGTLLVAKAGAGGSVLAAGTSLIGAQGALGGIAASGAGDIKASGSAGGAAVRLSGTTGMSGYGGSSTLGGSATARVSATSGVPGLTYGGGGSGALSTGASQIGGSGADGFIKVNEYS